MSCKILVAIGSQLLADYQKEALLNDSDTLWRHSSRAFDTAAALVLVLLFSSTLSFFASYYVMLERRHYFRKIVKANLVADDGQTVPHVPSSRAS